MKKAILVVSFGTSYHDTLEKTILATEEAIAQANPGWEVRRAFTSAIIMRKLLARDNLQIDSVAQAMAKLEAQGFTVTYLQPDAQGRITLDALREAVTGYLRKEFNPEYGAMDFVGAFQVDWNLLMNSILKENTNLSVTELRRGGFSRWITTDMDDATGLTELLDIDGFSSLNVARIRSYIQENIADVTRNSIAEHFHFSPNYLSKLFRNVEGVSLITYIQNQRMERAKELLANTDQSISEIAMEIGYPNFSHFSKRFRLFFGCSPNEYRRNARANTKKGSSQ